MMRAHITEPSPFEVSLLAPFKKVGSQLNVANPFVLAKFVRGKAAWYVFWFNKETRTCATYFMWYTNAWFTTLSIQDLIMENAIRDKSFIPCRLPDIQSGKVN